MDRVSCCVFLIGLFLGLTTVSLGQRAPSTKPFVLGLIDTLRSNELGETRILNIYLPDGYSPDSIDRYPTIYLLDGSADEDFIHVAGLVQFANFPWVSLLPKSVVVGIATIDRRRDFTFPTSIEKDKKDFPTAGQSSRFINFLEKDLQPYIRQKYSAHPQKMLIGQSLGGLLATEILVKKPTLFTQYVIVSPSLWWDNESLLTYAPDFLRPGFQQKTSVFVAVGNEGNVMEADARRLVDKLKKAQPDIVKINFHYFADENHATILHLALYKAFKQFKRP